VFGTIPRTAMRLDRRPDHHFLLFPKVDQDSAWNVFDTGTSTIVDDKPTLLWQRFAVACRHLAQP
jgi:hypothetical protein